MEKQAKRTRERRPHARVKLTATQDQLQRVRDVKGMRAQFYRPGLHRGRLEQVVVTWGSVRWSAAEIQDVLFYRSWRWVVETGDEE